MPETELASSTLNPTGDHLLSPGLDQSRSGYRVVLEGVARFTPLWHGVDLTRMLVLDQVRPGAAVLHLSVLVLLSVAGAVLATWRLVRRMAD